MQRKVCAAMIQHIASAFILTLKLDFLSDIWEVAKTLFSEVWNQNTWLTFERNDWILQDDINDEKGVKSCSLYSLVVSCNTYQTCTLNCKDLRKNTNDEYLGWQTSAFFVAVQKFDCVSG